MIKKVSNESKLIYAIYIFIVSSWCLLFSYDSHLNTKTNYNAIVFGDGNVSVKGNRDISKFTLTLNVFYLRAQSAMFLIFYCILLFSICFLSL